MKAHDSSERKRCVNRIDGVDGEVDELLAIYDPEGNPIGTKRRAEVHRDGDLHWVSFLLAARLDPAGGRRFLLQLRGRAGDPYRGQVDCLAGGHIAADESEREAIVRECREEAGVELDPRTLIYLGKRYLDNPGGVCRRVIDHFYLADRPILLEETAFTPEAEGFVEVDLDEFGELAAGRRPGIAGLARTREHGSAIHPLQITRGHLSAYTEPALKNFRRSVRAIGVYFDSGKVDESIWS